MTLWEVISCFCDNNSRSATLHPTQKLQKHIIGMFIIQLPNMEKDLLQLKIMLISILA